MAPTKYCATRSGKSIKTKKEGGCEIGLACDIRIASDTLRLSLPEVIIGSLPAAGGTQRLAKLIGIAKAKELLLLGEELNVYDILYRYWS